MPEPKTTGQLRTTLADMQIGDYIGIRYKDGYGWYMDTDITYTETPLTGDTTLNERRWYAVKVAKGLLISDRVAEHSISWDTLNSRNHIEGKIISVKENGIWRNDIRIRSLTGGVSYADANGNKSLMKISEIENTFPMNNEWQKYIVEFPTELVQSGYTLNDVFHWSSIFTWCQDTLANGVIRIDGRVSTTNLRVCRGNVSKSHLGFGDSNALATIVGFRPVFEYQE